MILFVSYFLFAAIKNTIVNYQLKKRGICTKAYVTGKQRVGSRGVPYVYYQFSYNNSTYSHYSSYDHKAEEGDSIIVVFLESNPKVNRSNSLIEKKCK